MFAVQHCEYEKFMEAIYHLRHPWLVHRNPVYILPQLAETRPDPDGENLHLDVPHLWAGMSYPAFQPSVKA